MVFFSLSVTSPERVAGDYDVKPAAFGPQWTEGVLSGAFVDCGDCTKPMRRKDVYRRIAICRRSHLPNSKSDVEMILSTQKNYAIACLVIMSEHGQLDEMRLPPGKADKVTIPAFTLGRADGQVFLRVIEEDEMCCDLVGGVRDMWTFGTGSFGQLGLSQHLSFKSVENPMMAVQEKGIRKVCCGSNHTLALCDNGLVYSWGIAEHGETGLDSNDCSTSPNCIEAFLPFRVKDICCGANHNLAIPEPRQEDCREGVWSWGINEYFQLGHSINTKAVYTPMKIPEMDGRLVKLIAAGYFHSMCVVSNFIRTDAEKAEEMRIKKIAKDKKLGKGQAVNKLPAWLRKGGGGDPDKKAELEKKAAKKKKRREMIEAEAARVRLEKPENEMRTLYTWGDGGKGQLGHGELYTEDFFFTYNPRNTSSQAKLRKFTKLEVPRLVESLVEWATPQELGHIHKIAANGSQSALLTTKGLFMTWGSGENGRLGHGDTKNRSAPTPVTGFKLGDEKQKKATKEQKVKDFAIGQFHFMVLTVTRDVFTWGKNHMGQCGHGADGEENVDDILVPKLNKAVAKRGGHALFAGDTHSAMITDNGEVFMWGQSDGGRLGINDPEETVHTPVCLDALAGVEIASMALGSGHTIALTEMYPADDTIGMQIATSRMDDGGSAKALLANTSTCCIIA